MKNKHEPKQPSKEPEAPAIDPTPQPAPFQVNKRALVGLRRVHEVGTKVDEADFGAARFKLLAERGLIVRHGS